MLAKKLQVGQPACMRRYTPSSKAYRDKHRHYLAPVGWVAALKEEGSVLSDQVTGEDSKSEVEVVGGLNVCLAQAMSHYQWEKQQCFVCGSQGHFMRGCPHHEAFSNGIGTKQIQKGWGKAAVPHWGQRVPDQR